MAAGAHADAARRLRRQRRGELPEARQHHGLRPHAGDRGRATIEPEPRLQRREADAPRRRRRRARVSGARQCRRKTGHRVLAQRELRAQVSPGRAHADPQPRRPGAAPVAGQDRGRSGLEAPRVEDRVAALQRPRRGVPRHPRRRHAGRVQRQRRRAAAARGGLAERRDWRAGQPQPRLRGARAERAHRLWPRARQGHRRRREVLLLRSRGGGGRRRRAPERRRTPLESLADEDDPAADAGPVTADPAAPTKEPS